MKNTSITYKQDEMVIIENGRFQRFPYNEIIDLVYDAPYVNIHTIKGNKLQFTSLSQLMCCLPEHFVYCNRAVVINALKVEFYNRKEGIIRLKNGTTYLVSARRREAIEKLLAVLN